MLPDGLDTVDRGPSKPGYDPGLRSMYSLDYHRSDFNQRQRWYLVGPTSDRIYASRSALLSHERACDTGTTTESRNILDAELSVTDGHNIQLVTSEYFQSASLKGIVASLLMNSLDSIP